MNCQDCDARLVDFVYGELPDEEHPDLEAHLEQCPDCAAAAKQMRQTTEALNTAAGEPVPGEPAPAVQLARNAVTRITRSRRRWQWLAVTAGLLAAVGFVGSWLNLRVTAGPGQLTIGWGAAAEPVEPQRGRNGSELPWDDSLEPALGSVSRLVDTPAAGALLPIAERLFCS